MHLNRMNHHLHTKWLIAILIFAMTIPCLTMHSSYVLAESDETSTMIETTIDVDERSSLNNPIDGLLDEDPTNLPAISSQSYLIYDTLSETMLVGGHYEDTMQPAAITQIMTVMIAMEELEMSDTIVITSDMIAGIPEEYVRIGFSEGEVISVKDCINACLLKSANDACLALAIQISGSEKAFVNKMNQRASEIGCQNTHFTNCYGRNDENHYTSCRDMALIMKEALRQNDFQTISTSASYTLEPTNKYNDSRILNNANRFVSTPSTAYEYYIGGKTGYAEGNGYTLVAGAEKDGRILVGVLLGANNAEQRYVEMIDLFEYCFSNYTTTMVDLSEFNSIVNSTTSQIEQSLNGTDLSISSIQIDHISYYSTFFSMSSSGYSHEIDLSSMLIDSSKRSQSFHLPIYRTFANGEKYQLGYMNVTIENASMAQVDTAVVEEKSPTSVKTIILTGLVVISLLVLLVISFIVFFKMNKKRKFNKNHRNPRIL